VSELDFEEEAMVPTNNQSCEEYSFLHVGFAGNGCKVNIFIHCYYG